jgi:hypothetical protein
VSELLVAAFKALGPGPTRHELGLVSTAGRESGDREALALWETPEYREGYNRLVEIAEEAGAGALVALDLYCEVSDPGTISEYLGAKELGRRVAEGPRR